MFESFFQNCWDGLWLVGSGVSPGFLLFPPKKVSHPISWTDFGKICYSPCFGHMMWGRFWPSVWLQFWWQDGFVYIFGGWNGDSQFNDLLLNRKNWGTNPPSHWTHRRVRCAWNSMTLLWVAEVHAWRWEQRLVRCRSQLGCSPLEHVCPIGRGVVICRGVQLDEEREGQTLGSKKIVSLKGWPR
jgi:hypothetical protein